MIDEWRTIPLSHIIELGEIFDSEPTPADDDGCCLAELPDFNYFKTKTARGYKTKLIKYGCEPDFIDFILKQYTRYLKLVKPMFELIAKVDPFALDKKNANPTGFAIKYSLVFDDMNLPTATAKDAFDFMLNQDMQIDSISLVVDYAIKYKKYNLISAVLDGDALGTDRFEWLIEQRKKKLGTICNDFLIWAENNEYADRIPPLLHRLTNRESLKIIEACESELRFGVMGRAFGGSSAQDKKEREVGNAFHKWWEPRQDSNATRIILEEILGVDVEKFLLLGIEQKACHKILGVAGDATKAQINSAFRKLTKTLHPDKKTGCTEKMKELNKARAEALA